MPKLRRLTRPPAARICNMAVRPLPCPGGQFIRSSHRKQTDLFVGNTASNAEDTIMAKRNKTPAPRGKTLRSQLWFDNPDNPGMTALYIERYLNFGLTSKELRSGKPIIGIAQTGSDLSPCN